MLLNELWLVLLIASAVAGVLSLVPITRSKTEHEHSADLQPVQEAKTAF